MVVNIHEAKTRLSSLIARVESGEEVVIGRNGRPVARLVPYVGVTEARKPGRWQGRMRISDDFDATPEWLIETFEGQA